MSDTVAKPDPFTAPFGSLFGDSMTIANLADGAYDYAGQAVPLENFSLHPATHVLHYGSACFEGLKAHRQDDGGLAIFRLDDHVERMRQSIGRLRMPVPDASLIRQMIVDAVEAKEDRLHEDDLLEEGVPDGDALNAEASGDEDE